MSGDWINYSRPSGQRISFHAEKDKPFRFKENPGWQPLISPEMGSVVQPFYCRFFAGHRNFFTTRKSSHRNFSHLNRRLPLPGRNGGRRQHVPFLFRWRSCIFIQSEKFKWAIERGIFFRQSLERKLDCIPE